MYLNPLNFLILFQYKTNFKKAFNFHNQKGTVQTEFDLNIKMTIIGILLLLRWSSFFPLCFHSKPLLFYLISNLIPFLLFP